ncbi:DUF58 domain-containing protein [Rhodopirellula sp. SWK7]|uniref:DUF58 domain-containing protein n=1 Tax=Rhodopirellula sp. SWK7 TaxID=595460 RepID=UPI0002BED93F|nr:DUF58 domain-containing protein [Rhodopirellula sp. SWK7]EMI41955.1 protein containing DUF58 [Rhodopirellula sp. SWK7]
MIPSEVLKKIKRIQLRTSHRVDELLTGSWHSAFKGRGIEFEEVRPYQVGDDVRTIDWNVTARSDTPFVKLFREERELAVMLLVDLSPSIAFGTQHQTKRELVTELGATLAMSAIKNNDKVGLTLFTDQIEKHIPPRKGSRHVLRLIREMLYCDPVGTRTDLVAAIDHFNRTTHRRSVVFWISDFLLGSVPQSGSLQSETQRANAEKSLERSMRVLSRRHDVIPIIVGDEREMRLPRVGLIRLRDSETGRVQLVDTGSRRVRQQYEAISQQRMNARDAMFARLKWMPLHLQTGDDIVEPLQRYFHRRERQGK